MNALRLTFRNSFKNAFQSVSQLFGLIALITILSLIVSLMTAIYSGVISNYNNLIDDSNLRSLVVTMDSDTRVKTGSDPDAGDVPLNNVAAQQTYLFQLNQRYELEKPEWSFYWSRTEERNFSGLKNNQFDLRVKAVAKTTPNSSAKHVDALVVSQGHNILTTKQTVLDATFAKKNNIRIGDILRYQADALGSQLKVKSSQNEKTSKTDFDQINQIVDLDDPNDIYNQFYSTYNWFQVVGLGESADFVTPTMDASTPLANKNTELIAYIHPELFGLIKNNDSYGFTYFDEARMTLAVSSSADRDAYYSLRLKNDPGGYFKKISLATAAGFDRDLKQLTGRKQDSEKLVFSFNDREYQFYGRTATFINVINIYNIIAGILLILVLGVVLFTIGLVTKKQVERTRSQIGLMKALGYRKRVMILNYSVLPFITSIIGSALGFALAQAIQIPIINDVFGAYFNLDFPVWSFDYIGFILVVFVLWLLITGIAFLIAVLIMRDNALALIEGNKAPKMSKLGMFIKKLNIVNTIQAKLRSALLASSLGKMTAVSIVVLGATIFMTASFAAPKILKDNQVESFAGINYQQLVEFDDIVYNNPYSFMQTYDPTNLNSSYQFAPGLNKITGLPIIANGTDEKGNPVYQYNMEEIINQLLNQKISSEYYGLEINNVTNPNPNPTQVLFANQKMLNSRSIVLNNHFLKLIADWAHIDSFGWSILNNQWPGYVRMINRIQELEIEYENNQSEENYAELMKNYFWTLQSFYRTYSESVALTIGRDYYYKDSDEAMVAYESHDYEKQIQSFNNSEKGRTNAFVSYKQERKNGKSAFGKVLDKLVLNPDVRISDGTSALKINSLYRQKLTNLNDATDYYLSYNPETILEKEGIQGLEKYVSDYLFWYSSYFSQRSGAAIIQAAFSRPPYFVQQNFKEIYNSNDPLSTYNFSFGIAPFNPVKEQLGIRLEVSDKNNSDLAFKIYGIDNNRRYVNLRNRANQDLVRELFNSDLKNPIIINQSLAFKLKLKPGDEVDFNVVYKELQNNNRAYKISDWKQPEKRKNPDKDNEYFISRNDLDVFSTTVKNPTNSQVKKISAGNLNLDNNPSEYYKAILSGEINIAENKRLDKFYVLDVHNGYGPMQAWMKNEDALSAMNYEVGQDYLWTNFFAPQFKKEFTKQYYRAQRPDWYFPIDLTTISYPSFLEFYVNNEADKDHIAALTINTLFKNAYPVFNYKYSLSEDIADLRTGITAFQAYGDYSPIALNGGVSQGVNYDGMGSSAIKGLIPVKISQEILSQLSSVIQAVLILLIIVITIITFIIILLTTSLIINDNIRFISTMKVLGYTNRNIINIVLGMYAIVIMIMFAIGYLAGWFIFAAIINSLGMATSFVLPLAHPIWLVFAVAGGIIGIYLISFALGYRSVTKNNATYVLQNQEI